MNKTRIPVPGFALVLSALGPPGAPGAISLALLALVVDSSGDFGGQRNEHSSTLFVVVSLTCTLVLEVSKHTEVFLLLTPGQSCAAAGHVWVLETTVI